MNEHDELCDKGIHNFKGVRKMIGWKNQYEPLHEESLSSIRCKNCGLDFEVDTVKKMLVIGKLPFRLTLDELLEIVGDTKHG